MCITINNHHYSIQFSILNKKVYVLSLLWLEVNFVLRTMTISIQTSLRFWKNKDLYLVWLEGHWALRSMTIAFEPVFNFQFVDDAVYLIGFEVHCVLRIKINAIRTSLRFLRRRCCASGLKRKCIVYYYELSLLLEAFFQLVRRSHAVYMLGLEGFCVLRSMIINIRTSCRFWFRMRCCVSGRRRRALCITLNDHRY